MSDTIQYEDFLKVKIQAGQVTAAERVPKSDKLLRLTVDVGEETPRTVLAGIGLTYQPEALVGRVFAFVTNLPPRKMMGQESNGMILAAGSPDKLALVELTGAAELHLGTRIG